MPPERASKAEEAIFFRMQALKGDPGGEDERRAAGDACSGLLALKTDMLQWPSARKILKQTLSLCDKPPIPWPLEMTALKPTSRALDPMAADSRPQK